VGVCAAKEIISCGRSPYQKANRRRGEKVREITVGDIGAGAEVDHDPHRALAGYMVVWPRFPQTLYSLVTRWCQALATLQQHWPACVNRVRGFPD
jgi:hypothetical protein